MNVQATGTGPLSLRILLIEDEDSNRRVVRRVVQAHNPSWDVLEADNGPDGLAAARRHVPHLIVLDLGLPGFDGHTVQQKLLDDPRTAAIPVVIHSADIPGGRDAHARGAVAFLPKPLDVGALRAILSEVALQIPSP